MHKQHITRLSQEQTSQLKQLWTNHKETIPSREWIIGNMKLSIPNAVFTSTQLFKLAVTLAEAGLDPVPVWLVETINPKEHRNV